MPSLPQLPVLIIGAGICGLALAQGRHQASIPVCVFERGPAFNIHSRDYRIQYNSPPIPFPVS